MKTILTTILFLLALTGCKIDLTIIGLGAVKTDSGSIDCATGTTGDCHQEYVTNANDCTVAGNCTVVGANGTTETFNALPSDDGSFGGWGDICFGAANLQCTHTITPDYAADPDAQLNVTATFDPDPTPQNATYLYNAQGQRASKTVNGVTTHFVYSDVDGQLLGEYTATGSPIREYIYLEGERVAMYDYTTVEPKDSTNQKAIVYLHNNQVGQVQYAFNSDGQMIYERVQTPFGETMGEINAYNLQMPVRFPGQYYDQETGFNQNWNRDYDSSLGKYLQPDPLGLGGGDVNIYSYVGQNPLMGFDPLGLMGTNRWWLPPGWCYQLYSDGSERFYRCENPPEYCPPESKNGELPPPPPPWQSPNFPASDSSPSLPPPYLRLGGFGGGGLDGGGCEPPTADLGNMIAVGSLVFPASVPLEMARESWDLYEYSKQNEGPLISKMTEMATKDIYERKKESAVRVGVLAGGVYKWYIGCGNGK